MKQVWKIIAELLIELLFITGLGLTCYGVFRLSVTAGFIATGGALVVVYVIIEAGRRKK